MRGLIMKDMLTIAKQAKAFLILILFFACKASGKAFAVKMLPGIPSP